MTVKELIEELEKIKDKSKKVYVWNGYNANGMKTDFEVFESSDGYVELH